MIYYIQLRFKTKFHNLYIMKFIQKFIQKFIPKEIPKPMGRWKLDYCNTKLNNKIDLSNEDHCGPCGQYAITKNELKHVNMNTVSDIKNDVTHKKT